MSVRLAPALEQRIVDLYLSGMTTDEVGAQVGCVGTTVSNVLRRQGVPARKAGYRAGVEYGPNRRNRQHGHFGGPTYSSWCAMKKRCLNPRHPAYERYAGRGIEICDRWMEFENFLADMGERPSLRHSLDRIDNDRGYEPGNCRWATKQTQTRNSRSAVWITHEGERRHLIDWCERLGVPYSRTAKRIRAGWSFADAIRSEDGRAFRRGRVAA